MADDEVQQKATWELKQNSELVTCPGGGTQYFLRGHVGRSG